MADDTFDLSDQLLTKSMTTHGNHDLHAQTVVRYNLTIDKTNEVQ